MRIVNQPSPIPHVFQLQQKVNYMLQRNTLKIKQEIEPVRVLDDTSIDSNGNINAAMAIEPDNVTKNN